MKSLSLSLLLFAFVSIPASAEFRTLVSADGKAMKAELVSHARGKVTIRREDGKEFEVSPSIFCKQDQEMLEAWMKETDPKINYRLKAEASKKVASSTEYSTSNYYEVTVRNDGQDAIKGITVMYRVLYENYGRQHMQEGEHLLEQNLEFNRTLALRTDTQSFSRSKSNRNSGMRGCLIRVLDPKGNVILDWGTNEVGMKGVTWESTNPKEEGGTEPGNKVEIR